MKRKIIFSLIVVCFCLLFTGCTSENNTTAMVGNYKLYAIKQGKKTYTKDILKKEKYTGSLIIKKDGTGTMTLRDKKYSITYDKEYFSFKDVDGPNSKKEYSYRDDKVNIKIDNTNTLIYEKTK